MTHITSYAQERINFYAARFRSETNHQLANHFNSLAASRGWTAERSYYSTALVNEARQRNINLDAVVWYEGGHSVYHFIPVTYDEARRTLTPLATQV